MRLNFRAFRAFPSSLFARMALIILAGFVVAQAASLWLQWDERAVVVSQVRGQNFVDRLVETVRVLDAAAPSARLAQLPALQASDLHVALIDEHQVFANTQAAPIHAVINSRLGREHDIRSSGWGGGGRGPGMGGMGGIGGGGMGPGMGAGRMAQRGMLTRNVDVRLLDGQWLRFVATQEASPPPASPRELIVQLLVSLVIICAVVMIAVRQATRPLQQLAAAADTLGRQLDTPALAEEGPTETRRAAQAFNRMQARIKRLVDERARALAAVSHDLRTPLTRLRLRSELVDDEQLRTQMSADLDAMAAMLDTTLDYLRGLQESESFRPIDMNALLLSLAEDAAVLGKNIGIEGVALAPYVGRLSALRRALQNLIDNAIKYGRVAHIRVDDDAGTLRLMIEDEGPGIPSGELDRVRAPYYRPDASRSSETGGVGLGLSIANDIALMHGGELVLANAAHGGLSAMLVLPREKEGRVQGVA